MQDLNSFSNTIVEVHGTPFKLSKIAFQLIVVILWSALNFGLMIFWQSYPLLVDVIIEVVLFPVAFYPWIYMHKVQVPSQRKQSTNV